MATRSNKVLDHFHRVLSPTGGDLTDGQLLARFVASRDEWAFAALVRRHGPMVLGVCRRMLRHVQDAEDCFQATFLVLARKAPAVRCEALGSWLYSVAYRTSLRARAVNARRQSREKQIRAMPHPEFIPDEARDWRPWLDHELNLLPGTYRAVIVACDLEGRSRREAARLLGLAEGTVSSRLARGRCLLAKRLSRYGLALSGGALAEATASAVPPSLVSSTVKAAVRVAAGEFSAVSTSVGILMKGAFETMLCAKLKLAVGAVMVVMALGATGMVYRASGQSGPAGKGGGKPATDLDVLRQEVELLKLKLDVVEQKLRSQEDELRAIRGTKKVDRLKEPGGVVPFAEKMFKQGLTHDFGTAPQGTVFRYRFPITNIYSVPMTIVSVTSGSGCVTATPTKRVLEPMESAAIEVRMDTRRFTGLKSVSIHVTVGPEYVSTAELRVTAQSRPSDNSGQDRAGN